MKCSASFDDMNQSMADCGIADDDDDGMSSYDCGAGDDAGADNGNGNDDGCDANGGNGGDNGDNIDSDWAEVDNLMCEEDQPPKNTENYEKKIIDTTKMLPFQECIDTTKTVTVEVPATRKVAK